MGVPSNRYYTDGGPEVSSDNLNSLVQTCDTANDLRDFIGLNNMTVELLGIASVNDGQGGTFYWNSAATAADDNLDVIVPAGVVTGAWLRLSGLGGIVLPTKKITVADSPYLVKPSDYTIRCDTTGGPIQILFPVGSEPVGKVIVVINLVNGGPNQVAINNGTSDVYHAVSPLLPLMIQNNGSSLDLLSSG